MYNSKRLYIFKQRLNFKNKLTLIILLFCFFSLSTRIYYENNIINIKTSKKEQEIQKVDREKKYKHFQGKAQPRIVAVNVNMNIFPKTLDFNSTGTYKMVNKTKEVIDSIFLNYNKYPSKFKFNKNVDLISKDSINYINIYKLNKPLEPGDSLELSFSIKNKPNTFFRINSPVLKNVTFINNTIYPSFGYINSNELRDDRIRKKYGLPKNDLKPMPSDTTALGNTYVSIDSDWIDFEATVSTDEDQIAIAPGYLQKEWVKNGRKYYHYKMDSKILFFFNFNSGRYEIKRDKWKNINIEIYYHKVMSTI